MKKKYIVEERIVYRDKKGRFVKTPEEYEDDSSNKYKEEKEND